MTAPRLSASELDPADWVRRQGTITRVFDERTQDSGNVSYLVETTAGTVFVKTAGPANVPTAAAQPLLGLRSRIALLRNAVALATSCRHPALATLREVVETPAGPVLVYDAAPGELIGETKEVRMRSGSAYRRIAAAPAEVVLQVLDQLLDAHRVLTAAGWIAGDLHDGSFLVELSTGRLTLVDLDSYHRGPTINRMGRMFGSSRFMAPEEFMPGSVIDERTTVFTLGRLCRHFGTRTTEDAAQFVAGADLAAMVEQACRTEPTARHRTVEEFHAAWTSARTADADR